SPNPGLPHGSRYSPSPSSHRTRCDVQPWRRRGNAMKATEYVEVMQSVAIAVAAGLTLFCGCGTAPRDFVTDAIGTGRPTSIIGGVIAGDGFKNVGEVVVRGSDADEWIPFCSGTLISKTVFLSAGHCVLLPRQIFGASV